MFEELNNLLAHAYLGWDKLSIIKCLFSITTIWKWLQVSYVEKQIRANFLSNVIYSLKNIHQLSALESK